MFQSKTLLFTAMVAAFGAAALAGPAHAAKTAGTGPGGTIQFSGKVLADSCQVAINGGNTVALPTVLTDDFAAAGDTAGDTQFDVALSGCDKNTTTATMDFSGPNSNIDANTCDLVNTATNGSDVQIRLLDASLAHIGLNDNTNAPAITIDKQQGDGKTQLTAQYIATGASTSPGLVNTSVNFTLTYQ
jgi:major type 1 subunit fimbrin (pilin)